MDQWRKFDRRDDLHYSSGYLIKSGNRAITMIHAHAVPLFRRRQFLWPLLRAFVGLTMMLAAFCVLAAPYQVVGGSGHTLVLDGDGTLWGWGYNKYGSVGDGSTIAESPYAQDAPTRCHNGCRLNRCGAGIQHRGEE